MGCEFVGTAPHPIPNPTRYTPEKKSATLNWGDTIHEMQETGLGCAKEQTDAGAMLGQKLELGGE